ncbi:MAG: hypothetical protein WC606_01125 [Candidatus Absconditabacterales bacterium]|jgi:hypothetical protein
MHTKKVLMISFTAFSLLLAGCGSKTVTIPSDTGTNDETTQVSTTTNTATATREQCVEMMSYALKGAEYLGTKNMAAFYVRAEKLANLEKKYNVSEEEYDKTCNGFLEDITFMDQIEKRMVDLK